MNEIERIDQKIDELMAKRKEYEAMRHLRFFQGWTLQQIADKYGLASRQRVYQIVGPKPKKAAPIAE